jgi:hypothetical protein
MPKYTRRHFQDIASLIKKTPMKERKAEADKYCKLFKADNPAFDKKKFLAACGL